MEMTLGMSNGTGFEWMSGPAMELAWYVEHPGIATAVDIFYLTTAALGIAANLAVILTVLANKKLRTNTYVLMINAAVADLLVMVFVALPELFLRRSESWELGLVMCKLKWYIRSMTPVASALFMVALCAERFIAVTMPFNAPTLLRKRNIAACCISLWLISLLWGLWSLFSATMTEYDMPGSPQVKMCLSFGANESHQSAFQTVYVWTEFVLFYMVPAAVMAVLYGMVVKTLLNSIREQRSMTSAHSQGESASSRLRIVLMMVLVAAFFILTIGLSKWLVVILTVLDSDTNSDNLVIHRLSQINVVFYVIFSNLIAVRCFDSVLNPVIYFSLSAKLRQNLCKLFRWRRNVNLRSRTATTADSKMNDILLTDNNHRAHHNDTTV